MYDRTATQFDFMMKTIMIVLFVFGLFVFFIDVTKAAEFWVADPSLCPVTSPSYPAQSCSGLGNICGDRSGIAQCYDTGSFSPPSITATSVFNYSSSFSGGYLINCFATSDGDVHPYAQCDNELEINGGRKFWCDRNESCFATPTNKITICNADAWASSTCGNCLSGYADCDGNGTTCEIRFGYTPSTTVPNTVYDSCTTVTCASGYLDCNGNPVDGCEVQNGGSCSIGGLDGVWQGCACVPPISNFQTGIEAMYSTTSPLLWGKQFGSGDLVSFSNATSSNIFVVKNDASVFMSSTLATTTDKYFYNYNGDLYWGDEKLNTGGGVYTAGDGLNLAGYEFTVDTSSNFIWSGQHTFNATTTFPLGVWNADGKVGIGTTTPQFKLSLVVDAYDGMTIYNTSSQMLAGIGSNPTGLSGGMGLFNAGTMIPAISFDAGASSFINNNYNFGIGTSTPDYKFTLDGDGFFMARGLTHNPIIYGYQGEVLVQTGEGSRTFFYPRKSAFRSGLITDMSVFGMAFGYPFSNEVDQWDDDNIGLASFAANVNNKASGLSSAAFGTHNIASGTSSFVGGGNANEAAGLTSIILGGTGNFVGAEGSGIIGGWLNTSTGYSAFIGGGIYNFVSGHTAFIGGGSHNKVSGDYSFIGGGEYNEVLGMQSVAFGREMIVSGTNSFGINLFGGGISSTLSQDNTFAVMGGNVGIGTTTPQHTLTLAGDFDIAENGLLRFNGISGSIDQIIKINALGFPEWVDVNSLFVNNTTFNSSTEFNSTSTFNSTAIFEGPSYFNNDVFVSGTISSTNLFVNGNSTTTGDLYVLGQAIFHDILPADNLAYTIGTSSFVWKEGWFGKIIAENILFGENGLKIVTTTDGGIAFASSSDDIFLKIFSTGQVAVGTTTITSSLKMKVAGDFGATRYCDENGENCFDPAGLWTDLPAREIMTTTDKYSGNIITTTPQGSLSGYRAANAICNAEFSGSHFCFTGEIINIIAKRDSYVSSTFGSIINNGWIAEGPPGYIAPANDCRGFTTSSNSILGAWWNYDKNGGMGWRVNCSELFPISCCK